MVALNLAKQQVAFNQTNRKLQLLLPRGGAVAFSLAKLRFFDDKYLCLAKKRRELS
jgi:hypothetical protein